MTRDKLAIQQNELRTEVLAAEAQGRIRAALPKAVSSLLSPDWPPGQPWQFPMEALATSWSPLLRHRVFPKQACVLQSPAARRPQVADLTGLDAEGAELLARSFGWSLREATEAWFAGSAAVAVVTREGWNRKGALCRHCLEHG